MSACLIYNDGMNNLHAIKAQLNEQCDKSEKALRDFCAPHQNEMGLTSDKITADDRYRQLKAQFNSDFAKLRFFNQNYRKLAK